MIRGVSGRFPRLRIGVPQRVHQFQSVRAASTLKKDIPSLNKKTSSRAIATEAIKNVESQFPTPLANRKGPKEAILFAHQEHAAMSGPASDNHSKTDAWGVDLEAEAERLARLSEGLEAEDTSAFGLIEVPDGMAYQEVYETTLTPVAYRDVEFFEEEKLKIFKKDWLPIAFTNELDKNRILVRKMYGQEVLIVKTKSGEVKAFYNACRHRGHRLAKKDNNSKVLICPYHAWKYDLDGKLKKTPRFDEASFDSEDFNLHAVKCDTVGNVIVVNFDSEKIPDPAENPDHYVKPTAPLHYNQMLEDLAPYPWADMKMVRSKTYEIQANWKMMIDNFIEYYHLPTVHPELVKTSNMEGHYCTQKDGKYISFVTEPLTCGGTPADPDPEILPFWPGIEEANNGKLLQTANFHSLFPNMFWFLLPNHLFCVIVEPLTPTTSREHACMFVLDDAAGKEKYEENVERLWQFYDRVNLEDIRACEEVQRGVEGNPAYKSGIYVMPYEKTIKRFHDMVAEAMQTDVEPEKKDPAMNWKDLSHLKTRPDDRTGIK